MSPQPGGGGDQTGSIMIRVIGKISSCVQFNREGKPKVNKEKNRGASGRTCSYEGWRNKSASNSSLPHWEDEAAIDVSWVMVNTFFPCCMVLPNLRSIRRILGTVEEQ